MTYEHQSRIIGMALLLGKLSFQALESARQSIKDEGREEDLDTLLSELQRKGELGEGALQALQAQVVDLERLLVQEVSADDRQTTVEVANPTPMSLHTAKPEGAEECINDLTTPTGAVWAAVPQAILYQEDERRLLSVLTIPRWNNYVRLQFVGEGGMGRIFKAFDPTLNRTVALKLLRWVRPETMNDLIQEARNQAQVNHPNICKVFEVKEWHGQVYVAMQFIDGTTLDRTAPELSTERKVELMEKVADAVHAAHRHGLVHRDLKPTNIMVERGPEGAYTPYVMDFGLAQEEAKIKEAQQGTIMGTVHYMAPEQARGDMASIERRTDVYALGVTLYEIIAGAPPFHDVPCTMRLEHILDAKIPPLRLIVPGISKDLETIVMKCLEKDLTHRYESARALSEDLRRYRDGEPIVARHSTLFYRFSKFTRKHKTFVALSIVALMAVIVFAALGIHARITAANQANWAQHFGQEAERIEALLRYARLQPRHDIQSELANVRKRISDIEKEVLRVGRQAEGPGHYALGRAYLAVAEIDNARTHLDQAWEMGFRAREVAYVRGRVMGQIYAQALRNARTLQDPLLRQARIQEVENTLRDPAVQLLRQGQGSLLEPISFQRGLLAFYDRNYQEALNHARAATREASWFYESRMLEAEVHLERVLTEQNPEATLASLNMAGQALAASAQTAPSDPLLYDLQARRWREEMTLRRRLGQDLIQAHQAFTEACEHWAEVLPGSQNPMARLAWGDLELARIPSLLSRESRTKHLESAIATADQVLKTEPNHMEALVALAAGLQIQAYEALDSGKDPRIALDRASTLLRKAFDRGSVAFELFESYAATCWARIEYEQSKGTNPATTVQEAISSLQELSRRFPKVADFPGFVGGIQVELADYQSSHGMDPSITVQQALAQLDLARSMAPTRFDFQFSRGNAFLAQAQYKVLKGLPAAQDLDAAEKAYQNTLALNPSTTGPHFGMGEAGLLRCYELERLRQSPLETLKRAMEHMALVNDPPEGNWRIPLFYAQAALIQSHWTSNHKEIRRHLLQAEKHAETAIPLSGRQHSVLAAYAQVQLAFITLNPQEAALRSTKARRAIQEALKQDAAFEPARRAAASLSGK